MPSPANPESNRFRCRACGRHFNNEAELREHAAECEAAKNTGSGDRRTDAGNREEGEDREWVSTP